jgi:phthiodiolone/phenolphthiodiolone dimycocerosates ketoreductase
MFPPIGPALESVRRVEQEGWDFVDYPDQIMSPHPLGLLPPPVPAADPSAPTSYFGEAWFGSMEMCAAASVLTDRLGILLAVIDPLRRSPAVMAQEMMTLQHMSGGRIAFAIGAGEQKQFLPFGETRDKPFARLEEAVKTWIALWESGGQPFSRESEFWPLKDAIFPLPMHEVGPPELLFVGGGPRIQRLSGTIGNGWSTYLPGGSSNDNEWLKEYLDGIKEHAEKAGKDPSKLRLNAQVVTVLAETDDKAWELAREPSPGWIALTASSIDASKSWGKLGFEHPFGDFHWASDVNPMLATYEQAAKLAAEIPDEITDFAIAWGGPERVAARIQEMIDAGINEVSFYNMAASADPEHGAKWSELASDVVVRLGGKALDVGAGAAQ